MNVSKTDLKPVFRNR